MLRSLAHFHAAFLCLAGTLLAACARTPLHRHLPRTESAIAFSTESLAQWVSNDCSLSRTPPNGVHLSLPFDSRCDPATLSLAGVAVLSRTPALRDEMGATRFAIVTPSRDDQFQANVTHAARGALRMVQHLPSFQRSFVRIALPPAGEGSIPVAFGLAQRGGGASVLWYVHSNADADELAADWVLVHELSHFAMTPLSVENRWLTEGIATYFQELLRVEEGFIRAEDAIAHFRDGLARAALANTGVPLSAECAAMRETHAFARVYWHGAFFALKLDLALRERQGSLAEWLAMRPVRDTVTDTWSALAPAAFGVEIQPLVESAARDTRNPEDTEAVLTQWLEHQRR